MRTANAQSEPVTDSSMTSPPLSDEKTSALLRRVLAELPANNVSLGYVMHQLRRRSFGGVLILLATLSLLPGISFIAGVMMIFPALQMVAGFRAPWLPGFVRDRRVSVNRLQSLGGKALPWIERIERFVKPRWLLLTLPPLTTLVGLLVIGLALVITIPLPFSNVPPAIAVFCLAFGMLERDGVLIFIGWIASAIALTIGFLIGSVAIESATRLLAS